METENFETIVPTTGQPKENVIMIAGGTANIPGLYEHYKDKLTEYEEITWTVVKNKKPELSSWTGTSIAING